MADYPVLAATDDRVWFCNCDVTEKRLLAGMVYLSVGLPSELDLFADGVLVCSIEIPEAVRAATQFVPFAASNPDDAIEFKVAKLCHDALNPVTQF